MNTLSEVLRLGFDRGSHNPEQCGSLLAGLRRPSRTAALPLWL